MDKESKLQLYQTALETYGVEAQCNMVYEECGELLTALSRFYRGRSTIGDVITELADVSIMVEQMALAFGYNSFENEKDLKLNRLSQRLKNKIEENKKTYEASGKEKDV